MDAVRLAQLAEQCNLVVSRMLVPELILDNQLPRRVLAVWKDAVFDGGRGLREQTGIAKGR